MRNMLGWQILALLAAPAWALAEVPVEELPPPKTETSVLVQPKHAHRERQPLGWGLVGSSGRHYFVGPEALADYRWGGQRHIVALAQEDPASHPSADPKFLYYREPEGRRWAFGRQPSADGNYRVYSQDAGAAGGGPFSSGRGTWDGLSLDEPQAVLYWNEPGCGR